VLSINPRYEGCDIGYKSLDDVTGKYMFHNLASILGGSGSV
jgi:hypothetical protein